MALDALTDPRFSGAVAILLEALRADDVGVACSPRAVPARQLREIYGARLEHARLRALDVAVLVALVELFEESPDAAWDLVSIESHVANGVLFVCSNARSGCFAARASDAETHPTCSRPALDE